MTSDAELIAQSLAGDADAFVEMIRRHEAAVGAYLARRAGRDLAEDLRPRHHAKEGHRAGRPAADGGTAG
jgi:hypothetical protein